MAKTTTQDLRQQVGQLLILGYDGLAVDSKLRTTLSTLQPSGVILFARNIEEPQTNMAFAARFASHHACPDVSLR